MSPAINDCPLMQHGSQAVASSNDERPTATAVKKLLTESVAASEAAWRRELRALEGRQGEVVGKLEAAAGAAKAAGAHAESLGQQLVSGCVLCAMCYVLCVHAAAANDHQLGAFMQV